MIVPRFVLGGRGYTAPSDQLVVAGVGVGGKGESDLAALPKAAKPASATSATWTTAAPPARSQAFPKAKYYKDWRQMLDKEGKNIDAVSVSTPDHNHAVVNPGGHAAGQARVRAKAADPRHLRSPRPHRSGQKYKVVTQMGNQGASNDGVRQLQEWYDAGTHRRRAHRVLLDRPPRVAPGHCLARPASRRARRAGLGPVAGHGPAAATTSISWCPSTGAAGGSTAPAPSATWAAT